MFCNGLKESHEERVEIKGLDSATMSVLLDYTYTSRAHLTHANVQRILEAASQFQVQVHRKLQLLQSSGSCINCSVRKRHFSLRH